MRRLLTVLALALAMLVSCSSDSESLFDYLNTSLAGIPDTSYEEVDEILSSASAVTVIAATEEDEDGETLVYVDHFGLYPVFEFTVSSATLSSDFDDYSDTTTYYVTMLSSISYDELLTLAEALDRAENTSAEALKEILSETLEGEVVQAAAATASLYVSVIDYFIDLVGYDLDDLEDEDEDVQEILSYVKLLRDGLLGLSTADSISKGDILLIQLLDSTVVDLFDAAYDYLMDDFDLDNLEDMAGVITDEILTDLGTLLNLSAMTDGMEGMESGISECLNGIWDYCMGLLDDLL